MTRLFTKTLFVLLLFIGSQANSQTLFNEEFNGTIGAWTTTTTNAANRQYAWDWCAQGRRRRINQTQPLRAPINSPTAANGAMAISADSIQYTISNPPAGPPYPVLKGDLTSPNIDCSNFSVVRLTFNQRFAPLNGGDISERGSMLTYSIDGGTTWVDTFDLNADMAANAATRDNQYSTPLCVNNSTQLQIKFIFDGDFYFWVIDDVKVEGVTANDLKIAPDYVGIAVNHKTPSAQIEPVFFAADAQNKGTTVVDMRLALDITGAGTYSAQDNETQVDPCAARRTGLETGRVEFYLSTATGANATTPGPGAPFTPAAIGVYNGTYTLSNPANANDDTPANNTFNFNFEVTADMFSKDNGTINGDIFPAVTNPGPSTVWAFGNMYHIVNTQFANYVEVAFGNAQAKVGKSFNVYLYKWDPATTTLNLANLGNALAFASGTIDATHLNNTPIRLEITDNNSFNPCLALDADSDYAVLIESNVLDSLNVSSCESLLDYRAARGESSNHYPRMRFGPMVKATNASGAYQLYTIGFGENQIPVTRLITNNNCVISTDEVVASTVAAEIQPNPASDQINVKVDLANAGKASVSIIDLAGRVLMTESRNFNTNEMLNYNVRNFANGVYNLTITTDNGTITKRFVVAK